MSPHALRRTMPAVLTCLGLLAGAGPAAALGDVLSPPVLGPCQNGNECTCPSDPQNYLTNIPGYVEECRNPPR